MRVTKDHTSAWHFFTPWATLVLRLHTLMSNRAGLVEEWTGSGVAGDGTTVTDTGGALVQLPLLSRVVCEAMQDTGTLQPGPSTAPGATLPLLYHLVVVRAVEDRAGDALAGDETIEAGTGGAGVQLPFHPGDVKERIEEAPATRGGDELSGTLAGHAASIRCRDVVGWRT